MCASVGSWSWSALGGTPELRARELPSGLINSSSHPLYFDQPLPYSPPLPERPHSATQCRADAPFAPPWNHKSGDPKDTRTHRRAGLAEKGWYYPEHTHTPSEIRPRLLGCSESRRVRPIGGVGSWTAPPWKHALVRLSAVALDVPFSLRVGLCVGRQAPGSWAPWLRVCWVHIDPANLYANVGIIAPVLPMLQIPSSSLVDEIYV